MFGWLSFQWNNLFGAGAAKGDKKRVNDDSTAPEPAQKKQKKSRSEPDPIGSAPPEWEENYEKLEAICDKIRKKVAAAATAKTPPAKPPKSLGEVLQQKQNIALGNWVLAQREAFEHTTRGVSNRKDAPTTLTPYQISKLRPTGILRPHAAIQWKSLCDPRSAPVVKQASVTVKGAPTLTDVPPASGKPLKSPRQGGYGPRLPFGKMYARAVLYKEVFGDLLVPADFDDYELVRWIGTTRRKYGKKQSGKGKQGDDASSTADLTLEQIKLLTEIGFPWKRPRGRPKSISMANGNQVKVVLA